jgi:hypothetical protein
VASWPARQTPEEILKAYPSLELDDIDEALGHGFVYRNGTFSSFDFPGAIATLNQGINPRGVVVGIYMDRAGRRHGFLAPRGAEEGK